MALHGVENIGFCSLVMVQQLAVRLIAWPTVLASSLIHPENPCLAIIVTKFHEFDDSHEMIPHSSACHRRRGDYIVPPFEVGATRQHSTTTQVVRGRASRIFLTLAVAIASKICALFPFYYVPSLPEGSP